MKMRWTIALAAALLLPAAGLRADGPIPTDKQKVPPKKVITEEDLRSGGAIRGTVSVGTPDAAPSDKPADAKDAAAGGAKGEAAAKEEPSESDKRDTRRKEIQAEIDFQSANIKTLQDQITKAQTELNDITDLTFTPGGSSTEGRRPTLVKLIEDANAQIKTSQETIDRLEDEARRAGVPVTRP